MGHSVKFYFWVTLNKRLVCKPFSSINTYTEQRGGIMEEKLSKTELFIQRGNTAHNNKFDYYQAKAAARRKLVEQFIAEADVIHGTTYDYSQIAEYLRWCQRC